MVRLIVGGVDEQLHVAANAVADRALAGVGLFQHLMHETFDLGQHFIHQLFTGVEIVEHGSNRDLGLFCDFGVTRTANAATGEHLDGTFHQLIASASGESRVRRLISARGSIVFSSNSY